MTTQIDGYELSYEINDRNKGYPRREMTVHAAPEEIAGFVRDGFLLRRGLISPEWIADFGAALADIAEAERGKSGAEVLEGNGLYFRSLLDKSEVFHRLITFAPTLSIGRALLGPQVTFEMEARMALAGVAAAGVPWHIHARVIPDPMPPFFCYPHTVHGLIYLDPVGEREGALCVVPGSHTTPRLDLDGRYDPHPDEIRLHFSPGDCILIHGNLWHRTVPTAPGCGQRRLLLFGYSPSWLKNDLARGVKTDGSLVQRLRASGDAELNELLDGFHW